MWLNNDSKSVVRNSETIAILQYKIKKNFPKPLAGQIFGSLQENYGTNPPPVVNVLYDDGHYKCQCNVGSWVNQCNSQYPSCGSASTCSTNGTYDCGFLSWFQCNGDCFYTPS